MRPIRPAKAIVSRTRIHNCQYSRGDSRQPKLVVNDVRISVLPQFLVHFSRRGQDYVGAVKFSFIKDPRKSLGIEGQQYVATLCHQWLEAVATEGEVARHTHCFSVDVFSQSVVSAPASFTMRMRDVEDACSEIALLWESL